MQYAIPHRDMIGDDSIINVVTAGDYVTISDYARLHEREKVATLADVKRIEKKTFPRSEIFDFDSECKKANTKLIVAMSSDNATSSRPQVLGYLVVLRTKRTALLHKICVDEKCRGAGVGKRLLGHMINDLNCSACDRVQLWVDDDRFIAQGLYLSMGFRKIDSVADYYGPGRDASKMALRLAD